MTPRRPGRSVGQRQAGCKVALVEYQRNRDMSEQTLALVLVTAANGTFQHIDHEEHSVGAIQCGLRAMYTVEAVDPDGNALWLADFVPE